MPGVVTVTPAPSIDRSYFVDQLTPGAVHRATRVTEEFAGKGVNVSHALHLAGTPTASVVPLPADEWRRRSGRSWLTFSDASITPRVSISVLEPGGRTTKINQGAPDLSPGDWASLVTAPLNSTCEQRQPTTFMETRELALSAFEPRVGFVDHVNAPFPLHDL